MSRSRKSLLRNARQALGDAAKAETEYGYDALVAPNPEQWLALDEQERLGLALDYHRRIRAPLSRAQKELHATIHAVVENQIAAGEPPITSQTIARLMDQGLDRHETVHAVGSVLADQIFNAMQSGTEYGEAWYEAELSRLTPETWRRDFG